MNNTVKNIVRFIILLFVQVFILNQIEIGFGIQLMVYPLFIFLLPMKMNRITLLFIAFTFGIFIDAFSDTYGLHTSALLLFAFLKPILFNLLFNQDDYDPLVEMNVLNMGVVWYIKLFGTLLFIHHFWFFFMEMFQLNKIGFVLQKTLLSLPLSFLISILLQYLFVKKHK